MTGQETVFLIWVIVVMGCLGGCLICLGLCIKVYTEIMKEHTIRRRETQQK